MTHHNSQFVSSHNPLHSGIEFLRLLSMVFIMALHIYFFAFGRPTATNFQSAPLGSSLRFFWESLTIVGVNTFVLISGWFGIHQG
jgi:surface polysaccharide O-acyltransferase-like enzyme